MLIDYDEFQRDVRRRKRERWAKILATEPPGRAPGRRPRDPGQERCKRLHCPVIPAVVMPAAAARCASCEDQ